MAAEVKLFGHQFKRWQVVTVAVGGGIVAWFAWRQHKAAASSSASGTDPVTGLPASMDNQVDPATGLTYLQEAQQYGSVSAAEAAVASGSSFSSGGFDTGLSGFGTTAGPVGTGSTLLGVTSGGGYASDADWAQAVESGLADIGYTPTDIASAVGRYLAGLSLTPDQQNIINVAQAEFGPPPSGALPIIAAPATGTATSGDTDTTTTGTGTATGTTTSKPAAAPTLSGGKVISTTATGGVVGWTGTGATSWQVTLTGPGPENGRTATVGTSKATYSGLESGHTYTVTVHPIVGGKVDTGVTGKIDFATKKG